MTPARRNALLAAAAVLLVVAVIALSRRRAAPAPALASSPAARAAVPPSASPEARRARDAMHRQILEALRRRDAGAPPVRAASPAPPPPPSPSSSSPSPTAARAAAAGDGHTDELGHYDPEYIRENVREQIFPLLRSCYDAALARNPRLSGKLVFSFRIVGDAAVGGVIDESEFGEGSELEDPEMETCTRESMMTLTLDKPPSGGGYVTVKYPVSFSPGDDDEGDAGDPGDAGKR